MIVNLSLSLKLLVFSQHSYRSLSDSVSVWTKTACTSYPKLKQISMSEEGVVVNRTVEVCQTSTVQHMCIILSVTSFLTGEQDHFNLLSDDVRAIIMCSSHSKRYSQVLSTNYGKLNWHLLHCISLLLTVTVMHLGMLT